MSKTLIPALFRKLGLNQRVVSNSIMSTLMNRKNIFWLLVALMLGLFFVSQLFDFQRDQTIKTNEIPSWQEYLTSICDKNESSCSDFLGEGGTERRLTTREMKWCTKANVSRLNECINLFNQMDNKKK